MDKWLKRIWLVNGVLFLFVALLFISDRLQAYLSARHPVQHGPIVGERLQRAINDTLALQDMSSTIPRHIGDSRYTYLCLLVKDLANPVRIRTYSDVEPQPVAVRVMSEGEENNRIPDGVVNLLFMKDDGSDAHLLLHTKAAIVRGDIPANGDTLQQFNLYRIVFKDTDGDGRLTWQDQSQLFISDFDGRNLRPVTPDSIIATQVVKSFRERRLYLVGVIRPKDPGVPERDWPEKTFCFDLRTGTLSSVPPQERFLDEARQILQTR